MRKIGGFETARTRDKSALNDLAVFGGIPAFGEKIHVGRPNIGDRQLLLKRISEILDTRWLSNSGPLVEEFENRIAAATGVEHCVVMCNATVALEIAIRALGMAGEVIVPSFTFIATAHALQWQGITPVFADIDPTTHNIDPRSVEALITPRTTGIIGVHVWGRPCAVQGLTEIASRRRLKLLLDAAHGFGCSYNGQMIGSFGDAEVFSFHATKFINSAEGGAVVTNDQDLAHKIRLMRNFGFTYYDQVDYIGTNGKMNEISAAVGITNLESIHQFISVNKQNYERYREGLSDIDGIRLMIYDENEKNNYQYIVVEVDDAITGMTRDVLQKILWAENVLARRYFYPGCHRMEPYRSYFPHAGLVLPETERLVDRVLTLPTGTAVSEREIDQIADIIRFAVDHGTEITERLQHTPQPELHDFTQAVASSGQ